uniref:Uncharacterized protein n=1 Tax=Zea mays TaxID=4577 RepID=B6TTR4_MAIZE|nr:hypothetical protein [Zea mays]
MVSELIVSVSGIAPPQVKNPTDRTHHGGGIGSNFKTKMCENLSVNATLHTVRVSCACLLLLEIHALFHTS